ncbi:MAG TPA: arsenite methyltransferase [Anaerohalosphaeraceae bacterium]|nr:arsenite methyltransferase [Anaerohalosphaeraceae bacterium]
MTGKGNNKIRDAVRLGYADIARGQSGCCCGSAEPNKLAEGIGYRREELDIVPQGANMGLSCGNPTAIADLKPGQVVLDLGSGGGLDVFIAASKVGPTGYVIGVDMTAEMVSKARAGIEAFAEKTGLSNVEFRLGEIEHLPAADASVDVVISNCVVNLSPDKQQVWKEIARVLKPGGKACISDLALTNPLPQKVQESIAALIGCVAGAVLIEQTQAMIAAAGLVHPQVAVKPSNMDRMASCNDSLYQSIRQHLPADKKLSDYIVSADFIAYKDHSAAVSSATKELIALGASVACNCHPCVIFHTNKAQQMGLGHTEIQQAVHIGKMVRTGAARQMDELLEKEIPHHNKE